MPISDTEVEKALDYLRDNADAAAVAAGNCAVVTEYRKVLKAELRKQSNATVQQEKDDYAYSHEDYKQHLTALGKAIQDNARHKFLMRAAEAKIDAWRTACANRRIGP